MNILWIEDNENPKHLEKKFFLETGIFNDDIHEIIKPNSLDECNQHILKSLDIIDYAVIDINLCNFDLGETGNKLMSDFKFESDESFLKEAGFHLYLKILSKGFDNSRIIFLTGNTIENRAEIVYRHFLFAFNNKEKEKIQSVLEKDAKSIFKEEEYNQIVDLFNKDKIDDLKYYWEGLIDEYGDNKSENTYSTFEKIFHEARMPLANSISKENHSDFHNWLENKLRPNKLNYKYIQLRRGIIEGCEYLIKKLEGIKNKKPSRINDPRKIDQLSNSNSDFLLFNKTLTEDKNRFNITYFIDLLEKVKSFFPLKTPSDKKKEFKIFLREISSEWEGSKGYLSAKVKNKRFKNFCQKEMKLLRNWTAHNQISKDIQEEEVAFFFMIAMRAFFDLPIYEIHKYEKILGSIYNKKDWNKGDLLKNELPESYYNLRKQFDNKNFNPHKDDFNSLLIDMGYKISKNKYFDIDTVKHNSIKYFYQNFWHGIFPAKKEVKELRKNKTSVAMFVNFINNQVPNDSFPYFLGKCIYNESFPKNKS